MGTIWRTGDPEPPYNPAQDTDWPRWDPAVRDAYGGKWVVPDYRKLTIVAGADTPEEAVRLAAEKLGVPVGDLAAMRICGYDESYDIDFPRDYIGL
jgi:hypothetical protein